MTKKEVHKEREVMHERREREIERSIKSGVDVRNSLPLFHTCKSERKGEV